MQPKREQALVGLFVLIAVAVLFATVFTMSGAFGRSTTKFHAYFPFAGGLEPGATVRYAGGPKVGRVESVQLDPRNPEGLDVIFSVQSDLPFNSDSSVRIMSMSPLGDNHLEILPGSAQAPRAVSGALLASQKYVDFNALTTQLNDLNPQAQALLRNLNDRASEVKETIARVNDLLSPQNRANLAATLAGTRGMIEENRPQVKTTLQNVNAAHRENATAPGRFPQDLRSSEPGSDAHRRALVGENRADVRQAVVELRRTPTNMTDASARLQSNPRRQFGKISTRCSTTCGTSLKTSRNSQQPSRRGPTHSFERPNPRQHKPGEQQ